MEIHMFLNLDKIVFDDELKSMDMFPFRCLEPDSGCNTESGVCLL